MTKSVDEINVSVIMATYNTKEKFLREAIASILNQSYSKFEFIVIDDCSTNSPEGVIKVFNDNRICYVRNETNIGLAQSLNRGISLAKGKYIIRIDSDDIALPNRISRQIDYMENHLECDIAGSRIFILEENGLLRNGSPFYGSAQLVKCELLFDCVLVHPSTIIRKSFIDNKKIEYNPSLRRAQDYDLWVRSILADARINVMKDTLLIKRNHDENASVISRTEQLEVAKRLHGKMFMYIYGKIPSNSELVQHEKLCYPNDYNDTDVAETFRWVNKLYKMQPVAVDDEVYLQKAIIKKTIAYSVSGGGKNIKLMYLLVMLLKPAWLIKTIQISTKSISRRVSFKRIDNSVFR